MSHFNSRNKNIGTNRPKASPLITSFTKAHISVIPKTLFDLRKFDLLNRGPDPWIVQDCPNIRGPANRPIEIARPIAGNQIKRFLKLRFRNIVVSPIRTKYISFYRKRKGFTGFRFKRLSFKLL